MDSFVDGISSIEYRDDSVRVTFYVNQPGPGSESENWPLVRLLFSATAWHRILQDLRDGLCGEPQSALN